ncbi:MAG: hypothetical protein QXQ24_08340 [Nitrososphaeria archaeon]
MTNGIYCLFNRLSCRYGDVMAFSTDGFAQKRVTEYFASGKAGSMDEHQLFKIGEINIATGQATYCEPTPIPWDIALPMENKTE